MRNQKQPYDQRATDLIVIESYGKRRVLKDALERSTSDIFLGSLSELSYFDC